MSGGYRSALTDPPAFFDVTASQACASTLKVMSLGSDLVRAAAPQGLGLRVEGLGFRLKSSRLDPPSVSRHRLDPPPFGLGVWGSGFRVWVET